MPMLLTSKGTESVTDVTYMSFRFLYSNAEQSSKDPGLSPYPPHPHLVIPLKGSFRIRSWNLQFPDNTSQRYHGQSQSQSLRNGNES